MEGECGFAGAGVGGEEGKMAAGEVREPEVFDFAAGDFRKWNWIGTCADHGVPL